jgi:single-strand DNA-binding protein
MNKWVGIGRLTKDSELKFTAGKGTANLTFTLAVDDGFGDNKKTYFIPIVLWGKSAESLSSYLVKGTQIGVTGKIQTRSYDAKDGTKRYVTEVVADQFGGVEFLGGKGNKSNEQSMPVDTFGGGFEEDITPVDDGDMPF